MTNIEDCITRKIKDLIPGDLFKVDLSDDAIYMKVKTSMFVDATVAVNLETATVVIFNENELVYYPVK